ncbi:CRISPR-associated helicase Cas3', partial [Planctomycetota bacterium]
LADPTPVNSIRKTVSNLCRVRAELPPGFFSLCVPTGGGKTIASLRFALYHALHHKDEPGFDRVIVAVPFTSIIEQNARVYRELFSDLGSDLVLEHHSNLDPDEETTSNRLQAENWDAPLVVTTNVQFFESLFACRTSKCRKLHRIANSVIVLDEAQSLPIELLRPTLYALRELVESYGCSIVLCSATQPALHWRDDFPIGLKEIRPIIEHVNSLHQQLKRTHVSVVGTLKDDELAEQLASNSQVLCIVNTRRHAATVYDLVSADGNSFHLSTRMCAAHRLQKLDDIRDRLKAKLPCRVVSTQLIEAGVDIDFPIVYRASCGLDSLAQAAGRCNREGLLDAGKVIFFDAEELPPPGYLRQSADSAKELLGDFDDLLSPDAIEAYFEMHYWKKSDAWDHHRVLEAIGSQPNNIEFNFRQIADRYRFIRDESETILVGWCDRGRQLIQRLEESDSHIGRDTWRRLQRYGVQVRQHELRELERCGAVTKMHERWVLVQQHLYDDEQGLLFDQADGVLPVEDLMC